MAVAVTNWGHPEWPTTMESLVEVAGREGRIPALATDNGYDPADPYGVGADRYHQLLGHLVTSPDLDKIPPPSPLIDGVLYRNSLGWLGGKPGHCKSLLALDWSGAIGGGLPWHGHEVTPGPVLYVYAEGHVGLRGRVRAWEEHTAADMDGVTFLPVPVQLLNGEDVDAFTRICREIRPVMIVLDTQARVTVGAEENSAKDMGEVVAILDIIRVAAHSLVLVVHHEPRSGENLRGSTALEGAASTVARTVADGPLVTLSCTKQKDAEPFEPIMLKRVPAAESVVLEALGQDQNGMIAIGGASAKVLDEIWHAFGTDPVPPSRIEAACDISRRSVYRGLNTLVKAGLVVKSGTETRPLYTITTAGQLRASATGAK